MDLALLQADMAVTGSIIVDLAPKPADLAMARADPVTVSSTSTRVDPALDLVAASSTMARAEKAATGSTTAARAGGWTHVVVEWTRRWQAQSAAALDTLDAGPWMDSSLCSFF